MKKKITAILLLIVMFMFSCQTVSASTSPVLRCKTDKNLVTKGETITVTVTVSGNTLAFKSMLLTPVYDSDVFELVSCEWNAPNAVIADVDMTKGKAAVAFANETTFTDNMFSFVLKAKESATSGTTQIKVDHVIKNGAEDIFCGVGYLSLTVIDFIPGDVNHDGNITSADARLTLRAAVSLEHLTEDQLLAADINHDGEVTSSDARSILRISVGLEA